MMNQAVLFLLDVLVQPFAALLLLRFHAVWMRVPMRNSIGEFVMALSDFAVLRVRRFVPALGGLDTLVFAGGIGENAPAVRARICEGLEFLGIGIDEKRNATNAGVISTQTGRVVVRVMHTDEEVMIAKSVCRILGLTIGKENKHGYEDEKA